MFVCMLGVAVGVVSAPSAQGCAVVIKHRGVRVGAVGWAYVLGIVLVEWNQLN